MLTRQHPIPSGFNASSTASEVIEGIDLRGKQAIVTGGYSGLGLETVRTLRSAGAQVLVPARDMVRAKSALEAIGGVEVCAMDLLDPASVDAFALKFLASERPLHILVNSAGIMAVPELTLDARGYEHQFATNHLGHFQLVAGLWSALCKAQGARVVSVASLGHSFSPVMLDDVNFARRPYDPWLGYGQSKTANALFAVELDRRGQQAGVRAFSLHPGGITGTGLERHVPQEALEAAGVVDKSGKAVIDPAKGLKSVEQGAATQVWCATSPQLDGMGGVYCENVDIAPMAVQVATAGFSINDTTFATGVKGYAIDAVAAARLWELSEQMTGARFAH